MSPWGRITNQLKNWAPLAGASPNAGSRRVEAKASAVGKLLKGPWETAWVPLRGPSWTGRTFEQLTREGYRKNAVAHRAVKIIAESAAAVPVTLFRGEERLQRHALLDLLARPNPIQSGAELRESLFAFLQLAGNAYLEAAETLSGAPGEIYVLRPDRIKVVPGVRGWPERYEYRVGPRVHNFPVDVKDGASPILHLRLFNPLDDWLGMSPLEAAAHGIDIHNSASAWNKALFDNAARPSGALVFEPREGNPGALSDEQFTRLKSELEDSYQGARNAGRPFLLEGGLKWQQIAFSPQDMEFINSKHVSAREIALAFGVPPMILGIPGDNTFSNYQEANRALWRLTLLPLMEKVVSALNCWLTPRFGADLRLDFDRDAIPALQFEREALWSRVGLAGFLTPNEKRKLLGFEPIEGGDELTSFSPVSPPSVSPSGEGGAPRPFDAGGRPGRNAPRPPDAKQSADLRDALKPAKQPPRPGLDPLPAAGPGKIEGAFDNPLVKIWHTVSDGKVRDSHADADGQAVLASDKFKVGDAELDAPRDPDGPPEETANCRCKVEYKPFSELTAEERAHLVGLDATEKRRLEGLLSELRRSVITGKVDSFMGKDRDETTRTELISLLDRLKREHNIDLFDITVEPGEFGDEVLDERAKVIRQGIGDMAGVGRRLTPAQLITLSKAFLKELDVIKARMRELKVGSDASLFADDEIYLVPNQPGSGANRDRQGLTIAPQKREESLSKPIALTVKVDLNEDDVRAATTRSAPDPMGRRNRKVTPELIAGYEIGQDDREDKDIVISANIRHEIGHAIIRQIRPEEFHQWYAPNEEDDAGDEVPPGKDWFKNLSLRSENSEAEAWAESFAWFLSPAYPRNGTPGEGDPPRLPLVVEDSIMKVLQRQ